MKKLNPNEAVLLRIRPQDYAEIAELLNGLGYDVRGDANYYRVTPIPACILRKANERNNTL